MSPRAPINPAIDPKRYRADIDGLRAVAVLSVLLYHVGVAPLSGGYVGVDVFFVISGFLITRLIRDETAAGKFSFGNFYLRRARRLFPALAATIAAVLIAAGYFFTPGDLERVGGAALFSVFSASNIFFWMEKGYFDAAAALKPLLHTWSLSVEEQFYLVWPALLVFALGKFSQKITIALIIAAGLASLALNQIFIEKDTAIFYLSPFRMFEFAIGAGLVWLTDKRLNNNLLMEALLLTGLGMIGASVFLYTEHTPFPTVYALVPCIGAALAIYAGQARVCGKLLSNPIMVRIGLISYSLYLAHWPIVVFYRYATGEFEFSIIDQLIMIALSFAAAEVLYRFVETPFRTARGAGPRLKPAAFGLACAGVALGLSFGSAHIWANNGWPWRLTPQAREVVAHIDYPAGRVGGQTDNPKYRVLIAGDSHTGQFLGLFSDYFLSRDTELVNLGACLPLPGAVIVKPSGADLKCAEKAEALRTAATEFDAVILAARWAPYTEAVYNPGEQDKVGDYRYLATDADMSDKTYTVERSRRVFEAQLDGFVDLLGARKTPLLLVGQVPPTGADLSRCETVPRWRRIGKCRPLYTRRDVIDRLAFTENQFEKSAQAPLVRRLSFVDLLCPQEETHCRTRLDDVYLYRDDNHVNKIGAAYLGAAIQPELDAFFALIEENAAPSPVADRAP